MAFYNWNRAENERRAQASQIDDLHIIGINRAKKYARQIKGRRG